MCKFRGAGRHASQAACERGAVLKLVRCDVHVYHVLMAPRSAACVCVLIPDAIVLQVFFNIC